MTRSIDVFAACLPGLEPLVRRELEDLGIAGRELAGGVAFRGEVATILRAGLWLGCASHLLLRIAEFPCRALGELQRKAAELPWREWLHPNVPATIRATASRSRVYHTGAIVERVENAIAAAFGRPLSSPADDDDEAARIAVRFREDVCSISIDATSTPLHRRGWRLAGGKAPLREDLAHALLRAAGMSAADALLDPFCGAGTIAIEAAGIARGLPPGRLRPPPLQHLGLFDHAAWSAVLASVPAPRPHAPLQASDRDAGAIEATSANAERAGVADAIELHCTAFTKNPWLQPGHAPASGLLATNPPFGRRIAPGKDLLHLYQSLGHRIAQLPAGWRTAVLAHDLRLARRVATGLEAAFTTRHGGLAVTALTDGPAAT
ncbi:MAG: class I SAM-dependent RNA methyltransferase [Planctomycetes bacterium]|nr:class I SAM-dependent RNA methyltransferase [Planctomycetota bacterium]